MRALLKMFDNTRMIVLLSLTAGLYTALLIPFKALVIVPGLTEIRPAVVIPVICSLFFGPAAAWGAAFGNLIGDFFGMFGPASLFGMLGNFLFGYLPYRVWLQADTQTVRLSSARDFARYFVAASSASLACAVTIAWGVDLLGLFPFVALANLIAINNLLVTLVLGPILLRLLSPRFQAWGLLYQRILKDQVGPSSRVAHLTGITLVYAGALVALVSANLHLFGVTFDPHTTVVLPVLGWHLTIRLGITPGVLMLLAGAALV